jgi:hypothetical protein
VKHVSISEKDSGIDNITWNTWIHTKNGYRQSTRWID